MLPNTNLDLIFKQPFLKEDRTLKIPVKRWLNIGWEAGRAGLKAWVQLRKDDFQ